LFGRRKRQAIDRYRQFVEEGKGQPSPWAKLRNQVFLGSDDFVEQMQKRIDDDKELSEIPSPQRRPPAKSLRCYEEEGETRNDSIVKAYESGGDTLEEIGEKIWAALSPVRGGRKAHKSKT